MCGIAAVLNADVGDEAWLDDLRDAIQRRGPDIQAEHTCAVAPPSPPDGSARGNSNSLTARLLGAVLHLQGPAGKPTKQPLVDAATKNAICWNGQVYSWRGGTDCIDRGPRSLQPDENDTALVLRNLSHACTAAAAAAVTARRHDSEGAKVESSLEVVAKVIGRVLDAVDGPFSFIFWCAQLSTLFFGRDRIGRRTLLQLRRAATLAISSVSPIPMDQTGGGVDDNWEELPTTGFFSVNSSLQLMHHPWEGRVLDEAKFLAVGTPQEDPSMQLLRLLSEAVRKRVTRIASVAKPEELGRRRNEVTTQVYGQPAADVTSSLAKQEMGAGTGREKSAAVWDANRGRRDDEASVGVLFSGGIDSVVLAVLADRHVSPPTAPIELINVCFYRHRRPSARQPACPTSSHGDGSVDGSLKRKRKEETGTAEGGEHLERGGERLGRGEGGSSHRSFRASAGRLSSSKTTPSPDPPDRAAAIAALVELRKIAPARPWRLVAIDIGYDEELLLGSLFAAAAKKDVHEPLPLGASTKQPSMDLVDGSAPVNDASDALHRSSRDDAAAARAAPLLSPSSTSTPSCSSRGPKPLAHRSRIAALARPAATHMDFNIGAALWFAARGVGTLVNAQSPSWSNDDVVGSGSGSGSASLASKDPLPSPSLRYASTTTTVTGGQTSESIKLAMSEAAASDAAAAAAAAAAGNEVTLGSRGGCGGGGGDEKRGRSEGQGVVVCRSNGCRGGAKDGCVWGGACCRRCCRRTSRLLSQLQKLRQQEEEESEPLAAQSRSQELLRPRCALEQSGDVVGGQGERGSRGNRGEPWTESIEERAKGAQRGKGAKAKFVLGAAAIEAQLAKDALVPVPSTEETLAAVLHARCPVHGALLRPPPGTLRVEAAAADVDTNPLEREDAAHQPQPPPAISSYRCTARVLLSGAGADEQMAGYSRHRGVWARGGAAALAGELAREMERIGVRNLGRDDRCVGDHGRELRFPYLDDSVVNLLASWRRKGGDGSVNSSDGAGGGGNVETRACGGASGDFPHLANIADLSLPRGVGDKRVLRELAARHLGLGDSSRLVKRAIQFGTGIAKLSNVEHFGSNRRGSGKARYDE